jgi:hypothetical protein
MKTANFKYLLVILSILGAVSGFGQSVSGYKGKRTCLEYNYNAFPVFIYNVTPTTISLSSIQNGELSFAINRKLTVSAHYSHSVSKLSFAKLRDEYFRTYYVTSVVNKPVLFEYNFIGADFNFYLGEFIAPVGVYINVGFSAGSYNLLEEFTLPAYISNSNQPVEIVYGTEKYRVNRVRLGLNSKKVIGSSFFLSSGVQANWAFGPDFLVRDDVFYADNGIFELSKLWMNKRVRWDSLFNFKLGIGIMFL